MSTIFTDFVRDFETESENHGLIIEAIRDVLCKELRRRGIFHFGPSLLGYTGSSWDDESLHDLAYDCLDRSILQKLRGLRALLKKNGSVDGVVVRNIKNFVGEQQRAQNPVGYAVFQNLKEAIVQLVESGRLRDRDEGSSSRAGIHTDSEFSTGASRGPVATESQLKEALFGSGSMFEGLPTLSTVGIKAQEILTEALGGLKNSEIASFSVNTMTRAICSLIAETTTAGRRMVCELFEDFSENCRTVLPDAGYEEKESFEHLVQQMRVEIDRSPRSQAVRERLWRLLDLGYGVRTGRITPDAFSVPELQSSLGIERTTVYEDIAYLGALRERVTAQQSLVKKNGDQHG